jgi:hypothetical protein
MNLQADYNDPFGPPQKLALVTCLLCDETYLSSEIAWSALGELWVCKNYARCGGAGYGIDIFDAEPGQGMKP